MGPHFLFQPFLGIIVWQFTRMTAEPIKSPAMVPRMNFFLKLFWNNFMAIPAFRSDWFKPHHLISVWKLNHKMALATGET